MWNCTLPGHSSAHVTMNTLEKSLDPETLLRIHRSIIVNVDRIKDVQSATHGEYVITLRDGATAAIRANRLGEPAEDC